MVTSVNAQLGRALGVSEDTDGLNRALGRGSWQERGLAFSAPGSQPLLYPADHTAAQQSWLQMLGRQLQSY